MTHHRLGQLSDGIFAIVMTLLVFEIRLPAFYLAPSNADLLAALKTLLPSIISYILSFSLLFTYWRAHHFFVSVYAKNVDLMLVNINAFFLMLISLIPFSASFLGRYSDYGISVMIFGTHIILIGITLFWMRSYVLYSEHIKNPEISRHEIRGSTIRTLVPVVFAIVAIILAYRNIDIMIPLAIFPLAVLFNLSSTSTRVVEKILRLG